MSGRILIRAIELALAAQFVASVAQGGDYRGAASGWPAYTNGTYAANYPANYGVGPTYYVARPVTTAGYAGGYAVQPTAVQYVPVRAAYANPTYYAAYGRSPAVYRPVGYSGAPTTAYYGTGAAPTTAYYAPVTANYAPANSYAVTPSGLSSSGSEAVTRYQAAPVNYVAPQYAYRTTYAPVPVYAYRPVTTYDPIVGQPVTCMQASTCNTCQPQRSRCFSLFNPFTWFNSSSCGRSSCGAPPSCAPPPCTTNYCGSSCAPSGCGQPYYPAQPLTPVMPVYPVQPAPTNVIPSMPRGLIPGGTTTIPPPPTVTPGTRTIITPVPADARPSLQPGAGSFTAPPAGGTFTPLPGTAIPAQPGFGTPLPGGSFQPAPPQSGSFGTGTNYPPPSDPYTTLTPVERPSDSGSTSKSPVQAPAGPMLKPEANSGDMGFIRPPGSSRSLAPGVQTVPDLDSPITPKPVNAAPKLLDPRDKTAGLKNRWAAVPAKWPEKNAGAKQLSQRPVTQMRAYETSPVSASMKSPYVSAQPTPADYDDRGWKSAAGF